MRARARHHAPVRMTYVIADLLQTTRARPPIPLENREQQSEARIGWGSYLDSHKPLQVSRRNVQNGTGESV